MFSELHKQLMDRVGGSAAPSGPPRGGMDPAAAGGGGPSMGPIAREASQPSNRQGFGQGGGVAGGASPMGRGGMMGGSMDGMFGNMQSDQNASIAGAMGMPTDPKGAPPAWQRYLTAQKMQNAYRNDWNPNPMLIQALEGGR